MAAKKKTPAKKKPAPAKKKPATSAKKSAAKKPAPKKAAGKKVAASKPKAKKATRPVRKAKRPAPRRKAPAKKVVKAPKAALPEAPAALKLARTIAGVATEKKAENVLIIDTRSRAASVGYDYVVIASGESDRQLSAIHEGVEALLKPQGKRASSVEASPDWVCVNYDEGVVAHFFTTDKRESTDLEGIWKDAPRVALS